MQGVILANEFYLLQVLVDHLSLATCFYVPSVIFVVYPFNCGHSRGSSWIDVLSYMFVYDLFSCSLSSCILLPLYPHWDNFITSLPTCLQQLLKCTASFFFFWDLTILILPLDIFVIHIYWYFLTPVLFDVACSVNVVMLLFSADWLCCLWMSDHVKVHTYLWEN